MASPPGQALGESGRSSQSETDQALDVIERPSPDIESEDEEEPKRINFIGGRKFKTEEPEKEEPEEEEFEHECERCGHEFKGVLKSCPNCGLEFDMESYEESEENEYQCYDCDYTQGSSFSDCPKCGASNTFEE